MARNRQTPTARTRATAGRPGSGGRPAPKPAPGSANRSSGQAAGKKPAGSAVNTGATRTQAPTTSRPWRRRLERASAPVLLRLSRVPRWIQFAVMLALLLAGLFAPGTIAAVFLGLIALFLIWLLALSWPELPAPGRMGRLMVIGLVLFSALIRLSGLHVGPRH